MATKLENNFSKWYILLLLVVVLPIYPLVLQQGFLLQHDIFASDLLHNQFPYRAFAGKSVSEGEFPLWMPGVFSGIPYLPQIEAGPLYLPNLALFALFDPYVALNLSIIFTFLFGALGAFLLARAYGADNVSASLGGLVFALSGFNVSHVKHMSMHEAAAVLPWMVLCLEKALRSKSGFWLVGLSLATALQISAGHPQITYYSLLFVCVRVVVFLVQETVKERKGVDKKLDKRVARTLGRKTLGVALAVILGFGICGLQLVTTYRFNEGSIRGPALDWKFASAFPYYLGDIMTFVHPTASGMVERMDYRGTVEWENYGYVGIIPLMLIVVSLVFVRRKVVWFYVAALVGSMLLVVGPATPLYRLLWKYLPGMDLFRFPTRFLLIVSLSAAMLSALGSTFLGRWLWKTRRPWLAPAILIGVFSMLSLDLFYWQRMRMPIDDLGEWRKENPMASVINRHAAEGRIYCLFGHEMWQRAYHESRGFLGGFEHYRVAGQIPFGNLSVVHGLSNAEGYTNMVDGRTASFWMWYNTSLLAEVFQPEKYDGRSQRITDGFTSLLNVANVRYLLAPVPVTNENMAILRDGFIKVYENRTSLPRAYLAYNWKGVASAKEAARWMFDRAHNSIPAIEGVDSSGRDSSGAVVEVHAQTISPDRIEIDVHPNSEGYLILTDSFDPGWRARIDGEPAEILPANGYQRAVKVGTHSRKVIFTYRPQGYYTGSVISIVSLIALGVWVTASIHPFVSRRRRPFSATRV